MKTGIRIDGKYVLFRVNQYYLTDITDKDVLEKKGTKDLKKYKKKVTMKVRKLLKENKVSKDVNVNFVLKKSKKKISRKTARRTGGR